ncbi:MAG: hypothetical protein HLX51_01245 [Micrococcaceae bacterium]|nr:hypothetical protein [Micrococcaceae bacterium]
MTNKTASQPTGKYSMMTGQQAVDSLPHKMPPIAEQIVAKADLPTDDFAAAFDHTFTPIKPSMERYGGNHQAVLTSFRRNLDNALDGLGTFFHLSSQPFIGDMQSEGWEVELTDDGALDVSFIEECLCCQDSYYSDDRHTNIGGTLRSDDPQAVKLYTTAHEALQAIALVNQLREIEEGTQPVWSFLPATYWQVQFAEKRHYDLARDIKNIKRRIAQREDMDRLHRMAREGQTDQQIHQSYLDRFEQKTGEIMVRGLHKENRTYWTDNSDKYYLLIYLDDEREDMERDADNHVKTAHQARLDIASLQKNTPEIFEHTDDQDRQHITELERNIDYYQRSKGWPSGNLSPRYSELQSQWQHFDTQSTPGDWVNDSDL